MTQSVDVGIIGAGPVGLFCAYLASLLGLRVFICDAKSGPNTVGRADALNARTLQILAHLQLIKEPALSKCDLLSIGKKCNTSSVFRDGEFVKRESKWWSLLEDKVKHPHFLMIGQAYLEALLLRKLHELGVEVHWNTRLACLDDENDNVNLSVIYDGSSEPKHINVSYAIGADGAHSLTRELLGISMTREKPGITWVVLDVVMETDFPKCPEIIVFQDGTADVAWIPREDPIDRFYIRMDNGIADYEKAVCRVRKVMQPYNVKFNEFVWKSFFHVAEGVAENFQKGRVFLAGDACHCHSVNGGQGLNTGLSDGFNLIWKIHSVLKLNASQKILETYESERKSVAEGVIESSGALVRATKFANEAQHAHDYVKLVERHASFITGMGVGYGAELVPALDFKVVDEHGETGWLLERLKFNGRSQILVFGESVPAISEENVYRILPAESDPKHGCFVDLANRGFELYAPGMVNGTITIRPDLYFQS